jgi:hypothetical protein
MNVILSAEIYLINPVMDVLRIHFPEAQCEIRNEETVITVEVTNNLGSSKQKKDAIQMDKNWKTRDSGSTIVIFEFKRRRLIMEKDFDKAIVRHPIIKDDVDQKIKEARRLLGTAGREESLLESNTLWHIKQISAYAARSRCPYITLFNWDHLILYEFKIDIR